MYYKDIEGMQTKLELAVLDSIEPTTLVDMTRLIVRRTPLYTAYDQLKQQYHTLIASKLEESLAQFTSGTPLAKSHLNDWSKRSSVFEKTDLVAPMVQALIDELHQIPVRMRESYIRQWRRYLVKKALAMIKFVEDETRVIISQPSDNDLVTRVMNALVLYDMSDFTIVLTQAEKLKPGIVAFISAHSKRL
ncbi:hypothetical protein BD560DRAFT_90525 [Blakeslea trispora]|nr:hypothetical protein BD560DRAFT_90525 [Blakeslea trispora]